MGSGRPGKAGLNVLKLRLPRQIRKTGTYRIVWVARSGSATARVTVRFTLAAKKAPGRPPRKHAVEIAHPGGTPPKRLHTRP